MHTNATNVINKSVGVIFLWLLVASAYGLELAAEVDRTTIANNESLRLIITADEATTGQIDFSQLNVQFDVINTSRSTKTSIINEKISATTQWLLILMPKETGKLIIPSFELGGSYSQALTITVTEASNTKASINKDVFIDVAIDNEEIYVQQQLLLTYRLYYRTALSSYEVDTLTIPNATIESLGEKSFQTQFQNQNYSVLEKRFALHPQASGELVIPELTWRLERSLRSLGFGRSGSPYIYLKSEPLTITVNPVSDTSKAPHWLPASKITLAGNWQGTTTQAMVGEPLNYQLTIQAEGLAAAQLPELTIPSTDNFTLFADQPILENQANDKGILGKRTQTIAIIPRQQGEFTIPSISLRWWNVNTNREEIAQLPEQKIIVSKASDSSQQSLNFSSENPKPQSTSRHSLLWVWQLSTLALALLSAILFYLLWSKRSVFINNGANTETLNPSPKKHKDFYKAMTTASANRDFRQLRMLIIQWGEQQFNEKNIDLDELGNRYPELRLSLKQLDNQLYGIQADDSWNPELLIDKIKTISSTKPKVKTAKMLEEIYY